MTDTLTLRVGDTVQVIGDAKYAGPWKIVKVNQRTFGLEQSGRRLRADKSLCVPFDGTPTATPTATLVGRTMAQQYPGSVVRYVGPSGRDLTKGDLLVVIADKWEKVNVTFLGGNDGRYWRMPYRSVEAVEGEVVIVAE